MSKQKGTKRIQKKHDPELLQQALDAINSKAMSIRAASVNQIK